MSTLILVAFAIVAITIYVAFAANSQTVIKKSTLDFQESLFNFSVYKLPKVNGSKSLALVLEGDKIDELGYHIYKSYTADLDKIDVLIRDNHTGEVMKIVKDGDSESMIGVCHPKNGHIGYLQFENLNIATFKNN